MEFGWYWSALGLFSVGSVNHNSGGSGLASGNCRDSLQAWALSRNCSKAFQDVEVHCLSGMSSHPYLLPDPTFTLPAESSCG